MIEALKTAISIVGGQRALARRIGKQQGHIGAWLHRAKKVPAEMCLAIEEAVDGKVTRHDLRPDVFGPAPDAGTAGKATNVSTTDPPAA